MGKRLLSVSFAGSNPVTGANLNMKIILTKVNTDTKWNIVANPKWDAVSQYQSMILENFANDYVEYQNCGCIYRMIRAEDWEKYGEGELAEAWILK